MNYGEVRIENYIDIRNVSKLPQRDSAVEVVEVVEVASIVRWSLLAVPADSSDGLSCPVQSRPAQSEEGQGPAGINNNAGRDLSHSVSHSESIHLLLS